VELEAHRNLNRDTFSIRCPTSKRVVGYSRTLCLQHASFVVSESGRQRVLRERQKSVHATVRGVVTSVWPQDLTQLRQATYDPYKGPKFTDKETGEPLEAALLVLFQFPCVYYLPK
jgi:hypothetical protein